MAQVLKEEVRSRITSAGLSVFADRGFARATMADIAAEAGISAGNVYRYFRSKDDLLREVVPAELARRLSALVRRRVEALAGTADVGALGPTAPWRVVSEALLSFSIAHRREVVVLLGDGKADGTEHAGFSERMVHELVKLAIGHARSLRPDYAPTAAARFALERIYRGFVATMTAILAEHDDEARIRAAVASFSAYHLAGLSAFFEEGPR